MAKRGIKQKEFLGKRKSVLTNKWTIILVIAAVLITLFILNIIDNSKVLFGPCVGYIDTDSKSQGWDGDGVPAIYFDSNCKATKKDNCPKHYNSDQKDSNGNGVGDMCDVTKGLSNPDKDSLQNDGTDPNPVVANSWQIWGFLRGDANLDRVVNNYDATLINNYLYKGGTAPRCLDAADANNDGKIDGSDAMYINNFVSKTGPAPPAPYPTAGSPTPKLGCSYYPLPATASPSPTSSASPSPSQTGY